MLKEPNQSATSETSGIEFVDSNPLGKNFKVERYRLNNGLEILIMEDPGAPLFAYHTWYKVGSRKRTPGNYGYGTFV